MADDNKGASMANETTGGVSTMVSQWLAGEQAGSSGATKSEEVVSADESISSAQEEYDTEVMSENSVEDGNLLGEKSASDSKANTAQKAKSPTSGKETIVISDDKGRRKIEVDFNNKDQLKKYIEMAHGARKWQAERDQVLQKMKPIETELTQMKQDWGKLEKAFQSGPDALFDLLQGRQGAFQDHVQKQLQRSEFLKSATPQEVKHLEEREQADRTAKDLEKLRKENEDFKNSITQEREVAETRALEGKVFPVFDKYRFAGKLGSGDDEHMFDSMLWETASKNLIPYEEQGVPLTQELIEKEFRNVAQAIRKRINVQAEKKVSRVMDQKKQEATENVQAKVKSGYRAGGNASQEARDMINNGDLTKLLKGWGKYSSLFKK